MKPFPQINYPIRLFSETIQHEEEDSALYKGIYNININHFIKLCLCPAYDAVAYGLPPEPVLLNQLGPPGQDVVSIDAARAVTIMYAGPLVLVEHEPLAGQLLYQEYTMALSPPEGVPLEESNSYQYTVYFYCLTHAEYVQYAAEVEAMMNREVDSTNPEEHPRIYNRLDNLRHYGVISRIHHLLTTHPQILSDYERELLCL